MANFHRLSSKVQVGCHVDTNFALLFNKILILISWAKMDLACSQKERCYFKATPGSVMLKLQVPEVRSMGTRMCCTSVMLTILTQPQTILYKLWRILPIHLIERQENTNCDEKLHKNHCEKACPRIWLLVCTEAAWHPMAAPSSGDFLKLSAYFLSWSTGGLAASEGHLQDWNIWT